MKGQTLIIQFILFFIIGFSLFISVAIFFKYQSDILKNDVTNYNLKLINSYISANALTEVVSCKQCDYANIVVRIPNTFGGNFLEIGMNSQGVTTTVPLTSKYIATPMYNLNSSYTLSGLVSSIEPISITFIKSQNSLRVS
jgi:hypothetical protein